jgi:2-amino-4-hydroxy-6-hydroxymethyldihydropteridine diphosphokinase
MNTLFLLLGANLGNEKKIFAQVLELLQLRVGNCVKVSSLYKSAPWGFTHENYFYNQVLQIQTHKDAREVLQYCLQIENELGRTRTLNSGYEARIIDIDILYCNQEIIQQEKLQIPHPRLHLRKFTLMPLVEVAPDFIHPVFNKTQLQLLEECGDNGIVMVND